MLFLKNNERVKNIIYWLDKNRESVLHSTLVLVVLFASYFLAPRISLGQRTPALLFLLLLAIGFFLILLRWPILGLLALLIGCMFLPFSWQGGINASQLGVAALLGVWFLDMLVIQRKLRLVKSRTILPALLFALISILSFFLGQFSWYPFAKNAPASAQIGGLAINLLSIGAFLLVAHLVDTIRKLEILTWSFIFIGSMYILTRFLGIWPVADLFQTGFTAGSLFWTWLVTLLAGQVITNRDLKIKFRVLLSMLLLITLFVAIVKSYDWRSGWFPPLIGLAVIIVIRYWRKVRYFAMFLVIPLYFIITSSIGQEDWSWVTRMEAWSIVSSIALVSPILGMGFANYYWYTPLFAIRGYYVQFNSHSQYIDLIAQTGIVGLLCFIWFFGEVGLLGMRLLKNIPEGFSKGYLYGAVGGLVGTIVAAYLVDWVLPFVYNIGMNGFRASVLAWLFLGGVVSIEQVIRRQTNSAPKQINMR